MVVVAVVMDTTVGNMVAAVAKAAYIDTDTWGQHTVDIDMAFAAAAADMDFHTHSV